MIDENGLIEEIEKMSVPLSTPDGSEPIDIAINGYNECLVDVLETIKEQPKVGEWISVEERLPENCSPVLAYSVIQGVEQGCYDQSTDTWIMFRWGQLTGKVTHWRPLPDKPTSATRKNSKRT